MSEGPEKLGGLRWRLRATRALWRLGATPEAVADAVPAAGSRPTHPVGRLDEPEPGDLVSGGAISVRGWLFFPAAATARAEVLLGGRSLGLARIGAPRLDVAEIWDDHHAGAGFELDADLAGWDGGEGEHDLVVVLTSVAGERHEMEPARVTVGAPPERPGLPAPAARTPAPASGRRPHVLVFTHQLTLGGAQLYLHDLLRELVRTEVASFTLVTAVDGPLRPEVEAMGIPVHITSLPPFEDRNSYVGRIEELAAWIEARGADVALLNTATGWTLPGAEAAAEIGLPVVWAIHESFPPSVLFAGFDPDVRLRGERALAQASTLVFEAEATKRLYEPVAGAERCVMRPYGLDLAPIDAHRGEFDGAAARREAGIPAEAELIVCVGTVEPRKAQVMLAQAFDLIAERHPNAWVAFVGGRDDDNTGALRRFVEAAPHGERMRVIPVTPEVETWYGMADVLVCASDIESMPRTVLEAMAWETPVLGTRVFGLPELIVDGETGWLCEPRDLPALAAALDRVLQTPAGERRRIGAAGRPLIEERHSLAGYGREIAGLLERALTKGEAS